SARPTSGVSWLAINSRGRSDQAGWVAIACWNPGMSACVSASSTNSTHPISSPANEESWLSDASRCAAMRSRLRRSNATLPSTSLGVTRMTFTNRKLWSRRSRHQESRDACHHAFEVDQRLPDHDAGRGNGQLADGRFVGATALLDDRNGLAQRSARLEKTHEQNRVGEVAHVDRCAH